MAGLTMTNLTPPHPNPLPRGERGGRSFYFYNIIIFQGTNLVFQASLINCSQLKD